MSSPRAMPRFVRWQSQLLPRSASRALHTTTPLRSPCFRSRDRPFPSKGLGSRGFTTYATPAEKLRAAILKARKQYPILLPFLFFTSIGSLSVLGLLAYDQYTQQEPLPAKYPPLVEKHLRDALHFIHKQPNPSQSAQYFAAALEAADKYGLDPFSEDVMGIRLRLAEMLESFGRAKASIEVLDGVVKDCEEQATLVSRNSVREALKNQKVSSDPALPETQLFSLIKLIIECKVKIASLYESDYLQDFPSAKKSLSDAIGLLVQHTQDVKTKGFNEQILKLDQIAAVLEQMGTLYGRSGEEANAIQTYMMALGPIRQACNGSPSCPEAQLLGNIAATMSMALSKPNAVVNGKPATPESTKAARKAAIKWADQSIATAEKLPEPERSACAATMVSGMMTKAALLEYVGEKGEGQKIWKNVLDRNDLPDEIRWMAEQLSKPDLPKGNTTQDGKM